MPKKALTINLQAYPHNRPQTRIRVRNRRVRRGGSRARGEQGLFECSEFAGFDSSAGGGANARSPPSIRASSLALWDTQE